MPALRRKVNHRLPRDSTVAAPNRRGTWNRCRVRLDRNFARPRFSPKHWKSRARERSSARRLDSAPALAVGGGRERQLKIAQAYWRLSTAEASYHWSLDERERLRHYTEAHTNSVATLGARASARTVVRDAQLGVAQAQQELNDLMARRPRPARRWPAIGRTLATIGPSMSPCSATARLRRASGSCIARCRFCVRRSTRTARRSSRRSTRWNRLASTSSRPAKGWRPC